MFLSIKFEISFNISRYCQNNNESCKNPEWSIEIWFSFINSEEFFVKWKQRCYKSVYHFILRNIKIWLKEFNGEARATFLIPSFFYFFNLLFISELEILLLGILWIIVELHRSLVESRFWLIFFSIYWIFSLSSAKIKLNIDIVHMHLVKVFFNIIKKILPSSITIPIQN